MEQKGSKSTWLVVGHDWAVQRLQNQIERGRLAHAYLFTGPAHIGKQTLGRALAQALLCTSDTPPCGVCRACRLVQQNRHPDLWVVPADGGILKVDQVRAVEADVARRPVEGRFKLFIFPDMHLVQPAAANALLKTLEEPPAHAIFILTAPTAAALLPTIVSRCQVYRLRPLSRQVIEEALLQWSVPPDRASQIAGLADGRIGWAWQAAHDDTLLPRRLQQARDLVELIYTANRWQRLQAAKRLAGDSHQASQVLTVWASVWRDLLLLHYQLTDRLINVSLLDQLTPLAEALSVVQLRQALVRVHRTQRYFEEHVNMLLALESLFLRLPRLRRTTF